MWIWEQSANPCSRVNFSAMSRGLLQGLIGIIEVFLKKRKAELDEQLRRYCRFDTEAMVEIVRFFTR